MLRSSRFGFMRPYVLTALLTGWLISGVSAALAQEKTKEEGTKFDRSPLLIINAASVERLLTDVDWTFEAANRPELSDFISAQLGKVGDLKGVDRDQPLGVMLFLSEGFSFTLLPVIYVPVTKLDDLMTTLALGPRKPKKIAGKEGRYELTGWREDWYCVERGRYAFLTNSKDLIDAELPDPGKMVGSLSNRYDVAVAAQIQSIPPAMRELFIGYLRGSTEAELQRRDNEAEGAYELRKAAGISNLEFISQLVTQGDRVTIGWDASQKRKTGVLEISIDATPSSEFSKYCLDIAGKSSAFQALMNDQQPFSMSASWSMNKREITAGVGAIKGLRAALRQEFKVPDEEKSHAIDRLTDSLRASMESGHMDFCVQFCVPKPNQFVLVGGGGMVGADSFATALREMLQLLETEKKIKKLDLDVATHQGVTFHRIVGQNIPERELKLYGGEPGLLIGSGGRRMWFAVGADEALPALKQAMDVVAAPPSIDRPVPTTVPFQVVFHMSPWLQLPGPDAEKAKRDFDLFKNHFQGFQKLDAARIDIRPTENGMRIRAELDEGYIGWLGVVFATEYDRMTKRQNRDAPKK